MNPLMLCVHMSKERLLRLSFAAMRLGVRVKAVAPEEENRALGALCGLDDPQPAGSSPAVEEEMLVFAFLPEDTLDRLLPALREAAQPPVRLKALLTPTNRGWSCGRLYRELRSEAEALGKGARQP